MAHNLGDDEMQRSADRWHKCSPEAMAHEQSRNAVMHALQDAREDILKMAELLRIFAYPRMGTWESKLDQYDMAKMIQDNFSLEDLDIE